MQAPTLTTGRLILRSYRREDFDAYAAMGSDPEFIRYLGYPSTEREDLWSRFARQIGMWPLVGFGFFAVEERASGAYLGEVGFQERLRALEPSIEGTLEAGWGIVPPGQGKGYATEAMTAALAWADEALPGRRITSLINVDNAASLSLARRLAFTEYARTTYHGVPVALLER